MSARIKPQPPHLTAEYVNSLFSLDRETGELYWRSDRPSAQCKGRKAGSVKKGRCIIAICQERYPRYHLVFLMVNGRWPADTIDHINGDSLDDRPSNLREATRKQNLYNKKPRPRRDGLPAGVYRHVGHYSSRITHDGVCHFLGRYDTAEDAHAAYLKARKEHFGEFA